MAEGKKQSDTTTHRERDNGTKPTDAKLTEGANQNLSMSRGTVFGDTTSSSGNNNNPGQHGRVGGTVDGQPANPAPSEEVIKGDRADENEKEG